MIVVAGTFQFDEAGHEDIVAAANRVSEITRGEEGCISYEFFADLNERGRMLVFEEWTSEEALSAHLATPHVATFGAALAGALATTKLNRYVVASHGPI